MLKKFSTSFFIYAGPLAYDFLQRNLSCALPSLRTVQRLVQSEYKTMHEGKFQFDDLVVHLAQHNAPSIISVGEDATRVISRVEYDCETDRCVGFVLPLNKYGLPEIDSFLAVSFKAIEQMFSKNQMAKYAYVYMAKPLAVDAPSFCLACFGTDNKFTAEHVMLHWQYICQECQKRGITVLSFGGDGDSRLMKSMRICVGLYCSKQVLLVNHISKPTVSSPKIPTRWLSWFRIQRPSSIAYVQDVVHIAVKLKSRLLKPSIVLPMGRYVAGVHHIRLIQTTFGKDIHGLRERDVDHKDKQNFDAVLNIIRCAPLLQNLPDALATKHYVEIVECLVDSYLSRGASPIERIEKIWYATFFVRYWREWVLLHSSYTLKDNFITQNAYMCIELNAHALLTYLLTIRDQLKEQEACFLPWLLGSQSCEKIFRSARSMTSTFSTKINFGMLGLMRRLHRLQIQATLQAESSKTGIIYPQLEKHKAKDGKNVYSTPSLEKITDTNLAEAIMRAEVGAKGAVEELGMADLLKEHKKWDRLDGKAEIVVSEDSDSEEDDDECTAAADELIITYLIPEVCTEDSKDIAADIKTLSQAECGLICSKLKERLSRLQQSLPQLTKLPSTSISTYSIADHKEISKKNSTSTMIKSEPPQKRCKPNVFSSSPFLKVDIGNPEHSVFIRKTTAVWLFQEGERVSSDRLFRVRSKQPYDSKGVKQELCTTSEDCELPIINKIIRIGEFCVFNTDESKCTWSIGRVLQFAKYKEKTVSAQQYKGFTVDTSKKDIGVLCSWFDLQQGSTKVFKMCGNETVTVTHSYLPISSYVCTLTNNCLQIKKRCGGTTKSVSVMPTSTLGQEEMATAEEIVITMECEQFINNHINGKTSSDESEPNVVVIDDSDSSESYSDNCWMTIDKIFLYNTDKEVLTSKTMWLNDNHITCAQILLKHQFSQYGGLQCTVLQQTKSLKPLQADSLQILHTRGNHWIAVSTVSCTTEDITVYDSKYSRLSSDTETLLARLVHTDKSVVSVNIANVTKQSGSSDCGLFAVAYITHIAFGLNSCLCVFQQSAMREHLQKCLEDKRMQPFPIQKERRLTMVHKVAQIKVHCYCRCPSDGEKMIACDGDCGEWFHVKCVKSAVHRNKKWFCNNCESS